MKIIRNRYYYGPVRDGDRGYGPLIRDKELVKECDIESLTSEKCVDIIRSIQKDLIKNQSYEFVDDKVIVAFVNYCLWYDAPIYEVQIRQPDGMFRYYRHELPTIDVKKNDIVMNFCGHWTELLKTERN